MLFRRFKLDFRLQTLVSNVACFPVCFTCSCIQQNDVHKHTIYICALYIFLELGLITTAVFNQREGFFVQNYFNFHSFKTLNAELVKTYPQTAAPAKCVVQKQTKTFRETSSVANAQRNRVKTVCLRENIDRVEETMTRCSQK